MLWCLHGALGSYRDWESVLPEARHVDLWSMAPGEDMHAWAAEWCRTVAQEDPAPQLLGYSMGGRLALHALLAAPDLWLRAVIVSAHPGLPSGRAARRERDEAWLARFRNEPLEDVLADWNAQPVFAGASAQAPQRFEPAMARCFQEWSLGQQEPLWDQLGKIACPVRWICGENDSKFAELGREAVGNLPQGEFVSVPGCGHRVPWEWSEFASHIE